MFEALREQDLDWSRVTVVLVDERVVPRDHSASNTDLVARHLLQGAAAAARFVHFFGELPAQFNAEVLDALVQDVLALAPLAVQETKRSINEIACGDYDEHRLREREHHSCASADFAEGRAAFAERRKPVFIGR